MVLVLESRSEALDPPKPDEVLRQVSNCVDTVSVTMFNGMEVP